MAVEIHQVNATSSDISFDLRMMALSYPTPEMLVSRNGSNVQVLWPRQPPGFVLESSAELGSGTWSQPPAAPAATNDYNTVALPTTAGAAFFRLRR